LLENLAIRSQNYQSLPIESQPHPETINENGHQCGGRTLQKNKNRTQEKDVKEKWHAHFNMMKWQSAFSCITPAQLHWLAISTLQPTWGNDNSNIQSQCNV
jgi:hypothetical protein